MDKEFISYSADGFEDWICICGNTPDTQGFDSCDAEGNEIEPSVFSEDLYVCNRCGRIIKEGSLEVVGQKKAQNESVAEF